MRLLATLATLVLAATVANAQMYVVGSEQHRGSAITCSLPDTFTVDDLSACYAQDYTLGNWAYNSGSGQVDHTVTFNVQELRYTGGTLASADQWGKVNIKGFTGTSTTPAVIVGILFRSDGTAAGAKYAVATRPNDGRVYVLYVSGNTATQIALNTACGTLAGGFTPPITIGAQVTGAGVSTVWKIWKSPVGADPTAWGAADCTFTDDPPTPVDTGSSIGIYLDDSGAADETSSIDDFTAGT